MDLLSEPGFESNNGKYDTFIKMARNENLPADVRIAVGDKVIEHYVETEEYGCLVEMVKDESLPVEVRRDARGRAGLPVEVRRDAECIIVGLNFFL